jgi:hypothetical protein
MLTRVATDVLVIASKLIRTVRKGERKSRWIVNLMAVAISMSGREGVALDYEWIWYVSRSTNRSANDSYSSAASLFISVDRNSAHSQTHVLRMIRSTD